MYIVSYILCSVSFKLYYSTFCCLLLELFSFLCVCKLSQNAVPINGIVTEKKIFAHLNIFTLSYTYIDTFRTRLKWMCIVISQLVNSSFFARREPFTHHHHKCRRYRQCSQFFSVDDTDAQTIQTVQWERERKFGEFEAMFMYKYFQLKHLNS